MKKILYVLSVLFILSSCGGYNKPDVPNSSVKNRAVAKFSYQKQQPLKVKFYDESSYSDRGVKWDFGDGITSTDRNPIHKYASKGVYNVKMLAVGKYGSDSKTMQITVTEPTKCYITGIVYEKIPKNNEYYNIRFTDDYLFLETLYWYTDWVLLSSANIPYTYMIKNKKQIDFSKSEYVMRLYQNGSTSGTGTQKASWSVYPENIKSRFAEQTTGTASNAKVTLLLEWKD